MAWIHWLAAICRAPLRASRIIPSREIQFHKSCGSAALWGVGSFTPHQLRVSCSLGFGASTSHQLRVSCSLGVGSFNSTPAAGQLLYGRKLQLHTSCGSAGLWSGASTSAQLRVSCSLVGSFNFTPAAGQLVFGRELQLQPSCGSAALWSGASLHTSCGSAALWGSGASTSHQLRVSCSLQKKNTSETINNTMSDPWIFQLKTA
jgi:hypothetical protein